MTRPLSSKKGSSILALIVCSLVFQPSPGYTFNFSLPKLSLPKPLPGEGQSISIVGSTVKIKGLTHQANQVFINSREIPVQKDGSFLEEVIIPLGETEMVVETKDKEGRVKSATKKIKAKANSFFLAGLADGTLNFSDASSGISLKRDSKSINNGFHPAGKISYYAAGKLQGKYLFKSAVDTDKSTQEKLFTAIDPDKYYPIYGDHSTVVYDVNSQGKFYALFEWDQSGATFGNYQTQIGDEDSKLITYNRTLYGGKIHAETPQRTVYGDPVTKGQFFWAEANQNAGHSELLATGGSLYYLRHRNIIEGSELVRIEVRDKRSGTTLYSTPQSHDVDYEIKYDEGRILFKKPLLSVAPSDTVITTSILEGNPVYVVANYEYKDQNAFPITLPNLDRQSGGFRFSQHLGDHLRGGITYVQEQKDAKSYQLLGGDSTIKLGNFTRLNAEFARSSADSTQSYVSYNGGYDYTELSIGSLTNGLAMRMEANSSLGEYLGKGKEFLDVTGYWQSIDKNFSPADSLFEEGTAKRGLEISHKLSGNDRLRFLYERSELKEGSNNEAARNQLQARRVQNLTTQWTHRRDQWTLTSEYTFKDEAESLSPIRDEGKGHILGHLLGERVQYDLSNGISVYLGQQFGLSDLNDSFTSVGFSKRLNEQISIHGQMGAGPAGNSVLAGFEKNIDAKNSVYSNYTLTHSQMDGETSIASFGSNTRISETARLRRERQFVTSDTRGIYKANLIGYEHQITPELSLDVSYQRRDEKQKPLTLTSSEARDAAAVRIAYILPDLVKIYARAEERMNSDDVWQVLTDTQGEFKLTQDLFFFGEYEYSKSKRDLSRIDKKEVALAYRPVNFDWFNALFKYIRLDDDRPQDLTSADGGFLITQSQSDVLATEFALDLPSFLKHFQIVEKLAFKNEEILAANTTNTVKTPEDLQAFLWVHRLNYHLTNRFDLAAEYRRLKQQGSSIHKKEGGVLVELTYEIVKHIAIGAGYNFTDFLDNLVVPDNKSARGFFLRLQGKY